MAFLDRYPALKKAVFNQYQLILVGGAAAFSTMLGPLPLLVLAGLELMAMPFLLERLKRRIEIEKKQLERQSQVMSQEQRFASLSPAARSRFVQLRQLCEKIQGNYRGLSAASQGIVGDQEAKFGVILASCLQRLWLVQKYDEMIGAFSEDKARREVEKIQQALGVPDLDSRVKEALEKNLQIRTQLLETVRQNVSNRTAILAELDSLEALLQLLLQKSVAATDAGTFSAELDDVLAQVESDAASIREMEQLLGAMPELGVADALSDRLRQALPFETPPPPPPPRNRQRRF